MPAKILLSAKSLYRLASFGLPIISIRPLPARQEAFSPLEVKQINVFKGTFKLQRT